MTDANMHSQHESMLLSAPLEVRRAIYIHIIPRHIHIMLSHDRIRYSLCLRPNLGDNNHDGSERRSTDGSRFEDRKWLQRLRSAWGLHWECEEVADEENADFPDRTVTYLHNLLFVCKKMFLEVCDSVAETTTINLTDLDTVEILLRNSDESGTGANLSWNPWNYIRPHIHKINVTLRLPLAFYKALEEHETLKSESGDLTNASSIASTIWAGLWQAIGQLQQLHSLRIWLDHEEKSSWSLVKERLVLKSVFSVLDARVQYFPQHDTLPHLDINFNIPKLHPRLSSSATHYSQDSDPPQFTIERRFRQRYHCEEWAPGQFREVLQADFPILYELAGVEEFGMTLQEVEEYERRLWNQGDDVERFALEIFGLENVHYEPI